MNNRKGDIIWVALLAMAITFLVIPSTRETFIHFTEIHPYAGGFVKFALLASMGDQLGVRISSGAWRLEKGFLLKAFVWGILGMAITLVFSVFMGGVGVAQASGKLPFEGVRIAQAFFGSFVMNVTFGPMMYIYHKFGDLCVDHFIEHGNVRFVLDEMIEKIDWKTIVKFSWLTTCLFVWVPLHTVVFLLPKAYQVLASAFLSILLGVLIAFSKKSKMKIEEAMQLKQL